MYILDCIRKNNSLRPISILKTAQKSVTLDACFAPRKDRAVLVQFLSGGQTGNSVTHNVYCQKYIVIEGMKVQIKTQVVRHKVPADSPPLDWQRNPQQGL